MRASLLIVSMLCLSLLPQVGATSDLRCVGVASGGDCLGVRTSDTGDWQCLGSYVQNGDCAGVLLFPSQGGACIGTHQRCNDGIPFSGTDSRCKGVARGGDCDGVRVSDARDWACVGRYISGGACSGLLVFPAAGGACVGAQRACGGGATTVLESPLLSDARCKGAPSGSSCKGIRSADDNSWMCLGSYVSGGACSGILLAPSTGGACLGVHTRCNDGGSSGSSTALCKGVASGGSCAGTRLSTSRDWLCIGSYVDGGDCSGVLAFQDGSRACMGVRKTCDELVVFGTRLPVNAPRGL